MTRGEIEPRLVSSAEISYDQSGNPFVRDRIDDVEIVNVPESMRFIKPEELELKDREILLQLLRDAQPHSRTANDDLSEGNYFASSLARGVEKTSIPAELLIGTILNDPDGLKVSGNILVSFHEIGGTLEPKIIGFEITDEPTTKPLRNTETTVSGVTLSPERFQAIAATLHALPREKTIPHPGTKEFVRQGKEYATLAETYKAAGLVEIPGAMFKLDGKQEKEPERSLVAVHPYYLEYHNSLGQRDTLTPESRADLLAKYDGVFNEHRGPLVIVEEQSRILETVARIRSVGRQGDTYFVITEDRDSSNFPFTYHAEFMNLLRTLGTEDLKFIGGHDSGDKPYASHDPLSGQTRTYSGCLRGLANRIEKRGFPKVETIPELTYS